MNQDAIWDHFQNEGVASFHDSDARLEFVARRLLPGEATLNIGVGNGGLEKRALAKGVDIWSLDPSPRAIAGIRDQLGLEERAVVGYSQNMPFEAGTFDKVVMSEVLEHLEPEILAKTIDEVYRVLKLNGTFLGTVPASEDLAASMVVCPNCSHHFHRWGHQRRFDAVDLRETLARKFGRTVIEEHFFITWEKTGWLERLAGLVKKFLSWRRIGTYGTARSLFFAASKTG